MIKSQQFTIPKAIKKAKNAIKQGSISTAQQLYNEVLRRQPNHPVAIKGLRKLGKKLSPNQSIHPQISNPSQEQINALIDLYHSGQMKKTEQTCKELLQIFPQSVIVINILGAAFKGQNKLQEAVQVFDKAIQIKPDYAEAYSNRGVALKELGQLKEAVDSHNKAIQIKPHYAEAYFNRGNALKELGKIQLSINSLMKAASLSPKDTSILTNLAKVLLQKNQKPEYFEVAKKLFYLNALDEESCIRVCGILHKMGKIEESLNWCTRFIEMYSKNPVLNFWLSVALKNVGRLPEAVEKGRKGLELRLKLHTAVKLPSQKTMFNTQEYMQVLWQTLVDLKNQGVHAFPTAGTLLGLIREGELLAWDKDIDLGLPFEEMADAVKFLKTKGWQEIKRSYVLSNPRPMYNPKHRLTIDLCGLQEEKASGIIIGGFWMPRIPKDWSRITEFPEMKLKKLQSPDGEVWWPKEPEVLLDTIYGDWRTPDSEFDTTISANNLRKFSYLVECYAVHRIMDNWNRGYISKALKIVNSTLKHKPNDELYQQIQGRLLDCLGGKS